MSSKGKFVISLDTEFAWGRIGVEEKKMFYPFFEKTSKIIDKLLELFEKYNTPATWAIVGRLLEDEKNPSPYFNQDLNSFFSEIDNSIYQDAILNDKKNSFLFDTQLVDNIKSYKTKHELATHTYNHAFWGEVKDRELLEKDMEAAKAMAIKHDHEIRSIVFPKNQIGHREVLKKYGILTYRSPDLYWYSDFPKLVQKIIRQVDSFLPTPARTVEASVDELGLVKIPGSLLFRISHLGMKKNYPTASLKIKAIKGLRQAAKDSKIIHLWFHPFNFGYKEEEHFQALEAVLQEAKRLREAGKIETVTMGSIAKTLIQVNGKS